MAKKITRRSFIKKSTVIGASSIMGAGVLSNSILLAHGNPNVAVAQGKNYFENTRKAVEGLGGMKRFVKPGSRVAVLANAQRNNPGAFTSPQVVQAVIEMCKEAGAKEVHCLTWLPEQNWIDTGLKKAVEAAGGKLVVVNLRDESLFKPVQVTKGIALKEARIMKAFYDYDVFINMPITKDHAGNKFTGTLKNLMGLNSPKNNRTFHKQGWKTDVNSITHLDQCIADLNTIIKPDLCIVDASEFIITNGPFGPGKITKPQKVIAGTDRVAVDSYCCTLWGLQGKDIIMIKKASDHGLGQMDLTKVSIKEYKV